MEQPQWPCHPQPVGADVEEELREVERALVRLEERREGLHERREAILKVVDCPTR